MSTEREQMKELAAALLADPAIQEFAVRQASVFLGVRANKAGVAVNDREVRMFASQEVMARATSAALLGCVISAAQPA